MGLFSDTMWRMGVQVEGCCKEAELPVYLESEWIIDNSRKYYLRGPLPDERSITHVMGPGNIHIYFAQLTAGKVEVESPMEMLSAEYDNLEEAHADVVKKLHAEDFPCLAVLRASLIARR